MSILSSSQPTSVQSTVSQTSSPRLILLTYVLSIMSLMVATGIGRFVFTPILPIMLDEQTVEMSEVVWLSSANYIGYFVGAMTLFKNHRHVLLMVVGVCTVTVATFLSSLEGFASIFLFRFLAGAGGAWALVSTTAWAVPWLKRHRIKRVGYIYTGVGAGICISGTICSLLILNNFSADELWYAVGMLSLLMAIGVCILLKKVLAEEQVSLVTALPENSFAEDKTNLNPDISRHTDSNAQGIYTNAQGIPINIEEAHQYPAVWRMTLAYGLFGFGYIIPSTFLPKIAKDMVTGNAFLFVWPVFGLACLLGVAFAQRFTHVSDLRIWQIAQTVLGLATLLPVFMPSIASLIITAILVGGMFMVVIMSILKISASLHKSYNLVALVTASFALGQLLGPLPALFFTEGDIWNYILPLSCISCLLGVVLIWQKS